MAPFEATFAVLQLHVDVEVEGGAALVLTYHSNTTQADLTRPQATPLAPGKLQFVRAVGFAIGAPLTPLVHVQLLLSATDRLVSGSISPSGHSTIRLLSMLRCEAIPLAITVRSGVLLWPEDATLALATPTPITFPVASLYRFYMLQISQSDFGGGLSVPIRAFRLHVSLQRVLAEAPLLARVFRSLTVATLPQCPEREAPRRDGVRDVWKLTEAEEEASFDTSSIFFNYLQANTTTYGSLTSHIIYN